MQKLSSCDCRSFGIGYKLKISFTWSFILSTYLSKQMPSIKKMWKDDYRELAFKKKYSYLYCYTVPINLCSVLAITNPYIQKTVRSQYQEWNQDNLLTRQEHTGVTFKFSKILQHAWKHFWYYMLHHLIIAQAA